MTDRERWTVYPLLFLALGISLKDKLTRVVSTDRIECRALLCENLQVSGADGSPLVNATQGQLHAKSLFCQSLVATDESGKRQRAVVSSTAEGGIVRTYGNDSKVQANMIGGTMFCRALIVPDESGQKNLAVVSYNDDGGFVRTLGSQTGTHTVLGNFNRFAGLLFIDAHGAAHAGPLYASPVPLRGGSQQGTEAAPAEQGSAEPAPAQPGAEETEPQQPSDPSSPTSPDQAPDSPAPEQAAPEGADATGSGGPAATID